MSSATRILAWLKAHLPTGLAGATLWVTVWFGWLLFVRRFLGAHGTFFTLLQIFAGITLVAVAVPFLWKLVRTHMLWSLRNKLVLTYLLIGLAPVVLFVTLVSVLAYVAAGQFAIHLVDSRIQTELNQMTNETAHRTDLVTQVLNERPNDSPEQLATAIQNLERGGEFGKVDRVGNRLRRETRSDEHTSELQSPA